jgi:SAM-dependent methyltransferase
MNFYLSEEEFNDINDFNEEIFSFINQYIGNNDKILELSPYKSNIFHKFKEKNYDISSIDFDELLNLEQENQYDLIYNVFNLLNILENLSDLAIISKKMFSLLKPKGHLILQFINSDKLINFNKEILTDRFQIVKEEDNGTFLKINYRNNVVNKLTPISFTDVQMLSNRLGAYYVRFYGNFNNDKFFKPESNFLIAVISKSDKPIDMSKQSSCSLI